ncbi:MAG: iron-sulfur cluster-binding flavodoxin [Proteobacteria bacterium]|nr:iron-sulfur cluster-binding flavodoxin [Pseudomonadota bacterium]
MCGLIRRATSDQPVRHELAGTSPAVRANLNMRIRTIRLITFSPTGTTRRIADEIALGFQGESIERLDLTLPTAASASISTTTTDMAIIGAPVYGGRLPVEAVRRFKAINDKGTPAVLLVVYGNRAVEDALLELRDLASSCGFKPIAAAAFIGEHSFSSDHTPIAPNRPYTDDLVQAFRFGTEVRRKMQRQEFDLPQIPGNIPYRDHAKLPQTSAITIESACRKCRACLTACPTAAISIRDVIETNQKRCILCCACIKKCRHSARILPDAQIKQIAERLSATCREPKAPQTFY